MSKAFTSEETLDSSQPGRLPERARPGEERPITRAGHQRLSQALDRLVKEEIPAAQAGDLQAQARLPALQHRAALLQATLKSVIITEPVLDGVARFGSTVSVEWEDGRHQRFELVGPDESEPREGRLSVSSPLARALLGRRAGDEVEVRLPKGEESLTVLDVG